MLNDPIDLNDYRNKKAQRTRQTQTESRRRRFIRFFKGSRLLSAAPASAEVLCARCHSPILGHASRCEHCGVHFSGYAEDFTPATSAFSWKKLTVVLVIIAMLATSIII